MNLTEEEIKAIERDAKKYADSIHLCDVEFDEKGQKTIYLHRHPSDLKDYYENSLNSYKQGATQERLKAKALEIALEMISKHSTDHYAIDRAKRSLDDYNKLKQ